MRRQQCWWRAGGLLGGLVLAAAGGLGLWLVVLGVFSAGVVLARHYLVARRGVPIRLAAWAAHAPFGPSPPAALEHAIAVDLAALSQGRLDCFQRARAVVEDRVDDPWWRALAVERLTSAQKLILNRCLLGVRPRRETAVARLRRSAAAMATTVLLVLGSVTQSRWWLLPLTVVTAVVILEYVDLRERRRLLPELLASRSLQVPIRSLFVMPEHAVARSLVTLAGNDRLVIQQALSLLQEADAVEPSHARRRLLHAQRLAAGQGRRSGRTRAATVEENPSCGSDDGPGGMT